LALEANQPDVWVVEPRRQGIVPRAKEVWQYRRLLRFFGARAVEKLYARTILGWSWILIRPLFPLFVKTLIFGGLLGVASDGVPYFLFLVVGTTIWELFAQSTMWATRSLEVNRSLLSRIYVPRIILPMAMITPALLTLLIHVGVLLAALVWYRFSHGVWYIGAGTTVLWTIPAILLSILLAIAIGLWTSVPALIARDVRFTLGYIMGFWIFLTPVMYPLSSVSPKWQGIMALNPMTPLVEMFKRGALGVGTVNPVHVGTALTVIAIIGISGIWFFARAEATAADRV
jgi:lipopolysaccharide transport system permease protein